MLYSSNSLKLKCGDRLGGHLELFNMLNDARVAYSSFMQLYINDAISKKLIPKHFMLTPKLGIPCLLYYY